METADYRKLFDAAADGYNSDLCPGRGHCAQLVLDFLEPNAQDVVLDIGCGPGAQLIALAPLVAKGYGLDLSEKMIARARKAALACSNLHFMVGTAQAAAEHFGGMLFDKIYSNYVLHHLTPEEKAGTIASLTGLLRPGGRLVLGDLMLSDDPAKHKSLFGYVGYEPESDAPETIAAWEKIFAGAGLSYQSRPLNPLVGLMIGTKNS